MRRSNRRPRLSGRDRYDTRRRRRGPGWTPTWWDPDDLDACDCPKEERDTETLNSATGYSDFGYYRTRCKTCGEAWCYWIEG